VSCVSVSICSVRYGRRPHRRHNRRRDKQKPALTHRREVDRSGQRLYRQHRSTSSGQGASAPRTVYLQHRKVWRAGSATFRSTLEFGRDQTAFATARLGHYTRGDMPSSFLTPVQESVWLDITGLTPSHASACRKAAIGAAPCPLSQLTRAACAAGREIRRRRGFREALGHAPGMRTQPSLHLRA